MFVEQGISFSFEKFLEREKYRIGKAKKLR